MAEQSENVQLPPRLLFQDRLAAALVAAGNRRVTVLCQTVGQDDALRSADLGRSFHFGGLYWALLDAPAARSDERNGLAAAHYPEDGLDPTALMQKAETRARGLSVAEQQTPRAGTEAWRLHYQPQVDLDDGRLLGLEALLRGSADREPPSLVAVAEALQADLAASGFTERAGFRVALNLSLPDLLNQTAADCLLACAQAVAPLQLEIEITEQQAVGSFGAARAVMEQLRAAGLRFALDDFGAGFATVTRLAKLPFDTVKIDKSFVAALDSEVPAAAAEARNVIEVMIALANARGALAMAEGIERPGQHRRLCELGCPVGQGYLLGQPGPLSALQGDG